jgi:hypothetical protein
MSYHFRLFSSRYLPAFDLTWLSYFDGSWRSYLAHSGSPEGRLLRDRLPTRHYLTGSSVLCVRLRRYWVGSTFVVYMWYFWVLMGVHSVLDWLFFGGPSESIWPSYSVRRRSRWWSGTTVFFEVYLACECLGSLEWKKPPVI